jgi:hypothetical protein
VRKGDGLTTFMVPKVEKIRSLNLAGPQGPAQACSGKRLFLQLCTFWNWTIIEIAYNFIATCDFQNTLKNRPTCLSRQEVNIQIVAVFVVETSLKKIVYADDFIS